MITFIHTTCIQMWIFIYMFKFLVQVYGYVHAIPVEKHWLCMWDCFFFQIHFVQTDYTNVQHTTVVPL